MRGKRTAILFDRHVVEAKLTLGRIPPEAMPELAASALEAGFDGPAIRRIAAFDRPSGWEVDQRLSGFREEIGMVVLPVEEAAARVAYDLVRNILDTRLDPLAYTAALAGLYIEADYPAALSDLYRLNVRACEGLHCVGKSEEQVRADIRDRFIVFVRDYEADQMANNHDGEALISSVHGTNAAQVYRP